MDYKEEFAELTQNEEVVAETEEEVVAEPATEDAGEYTPEFAEVYTEETESVETEQPKKKFPIQIPIIIAACVLVGAIVAFLIANLFVPTVEGTWLYESEEGYSFYYTFDQKGEEKNCEMTIGSIHFPGTYEITESEEAKSLSVNVYAGYVYGNYTYEIAGNKLAGNCVLTLTAEDGSAITLTQAKKPKDSDYITPDENFKEVEALTGEWEFYYPEYDASIKLTLNDDGTMIYDQFGFQQMHCVYTADDTTINLSFFETELIAQEEGYYFDNDQLIFLGLNWTRVSESTPDQA